MTKVHLDTDLGGDPDDVCALALLLKWPDVAITGITTVSDENGKRAGYTKYVLQLAGKESVSVKAGADVTGAYYRYKPRFPKEENFWPEKISPSPNPVDEALELLKSSIEQRATIIAIGPFTNLALLDKKYPGILQQATVYVMGGYAYPIREGYPQWTNDNDYNIQLDIASAKHVFANSSPTVIPLTVTVETALRRAYLPKLRQAGKLGELIAKQAEAENDVSYNEERLGKVYQGLPADILNFQHDTLACAVALGWDGVTIEEVPLRFEIKNGFLHEVIDVHGRKTRIVTKIDAERFNELWLNTVTRESTLPRFSIGMVESPAFSYIILTQFALEFGKS
ncbi:nucleoside hydrolase [Candidatus Roizmanbacteria bacterium]|nr:nucleoside hydrolase [Candidatus Roizmanbacteria bacterium]